MQNSFTSNGGGAGVKQASFYNQKQKGAQVIRLDTKDAQISMNLAGIIPNFSNLVATQNTSGDIYYQLRSFRCINPPQELIHKATFKMTMQTSAESVRYLSSVPAQASCLTTQSTADTPVYFSISDIADFTAPIFHSPEQLIYQMERSLLQAILTMEYSDAAKLLSLVMQLATFSFDQTNKLFKLSYIGQQKTPGKLAEIPPGGVGKLSDVSDYFVFSNIKMTLSLDERVSSSAQQQNFQRLFGTSETDENGNPKLTLIIDSGILTAHATQTTQNPFIGSLPVGARVQVTEIPNSVSSGGRILMGKHEHIYIRSNLSTNIWYKEGKKTNIISAIPLTRENDDYQEYRPCGAETRIFDIKDSLNSIQHMQIAITDDQENLVKFTQNYQMELAIFFLPDNQQTINF